MGESANPFAPPQAEVADVQADGQAPLAGRGVRLGAVLIDLVVQVLAIWLVGRLLGMDFFEPEPTAGALVLNVAIGLAVFLLVQGVLLVRRGQTIGKRLLAIRIVRPDGGRVAPGRLLGLRYGIGFAVSAVPLVGVLFGLVDALLIFRADRRCLHDIIADTIVVRA